MDKEVLEHQLSQLNCHDIVIVRPFYGTQSDSWKATLYSHGSNEYPIKFEAVSFGTSVIFTVEDVIAIDNFQDIIRLKGPSDYRNLPATAVA